MSLGPEIKSLAWEVRVDRLVAHIIARFPIDGSTITKGELMANLEESERTRKEAWRVVTSSSFIECVNPDAKPGIEKLWRRVNVTAKGETPGDDDDAYWPSRWE
jgi:hypothetical protein